jgi:hypothetical protein
MGSKTVRNMIFELVTGLCEKKWKGGKSEEVKNISLKIFSLYIMSNSSKDTISFLSRMPDLDEKVFFMINELRNESQSTMMNALKQRLIDSKIKKKLNLLNFSEN